MLTQCSNFAAVTFAEYYFNADCYQHEKFVKKKVIDMHVV